MIGELIVVFVGLLILVHSVGWWVKRIIEIGIEGRRVTVEQILSSIMKLYEYLTEQVQDK
jgi:hypothetical protein